jgi:FkbM family methyltransferase
MIHFPIESVTPALPTIRILDVGAMMVEGVSNPYDPLLQSLSCEVIGFEAVEAECERLNRHYAGRFTYLPHVVGDGSRRTFYECAAAYNSSLLEPNLELLSKFSGYEELFRVVATREVLTRRLDDIAEAAGTDFLKLDVQGGELMVLEGAIRMLRDVLVIHTEAEFLPMYRGQPLFSDLDPWLRARGFVLHRIPVIGVRLFDPFTSNDPLAAASQSLWCDVVYVRDFLALDRLSEPQLLKLAAIMHENYRAYDFAALALGAVDRRAGSDLYDRYVSRLAAA